MSLTDIFVSSHLFLSCVDDLVHAGETSNMNRERGGFRPNCRHVRFTVQGARGSINLQYTLHSTFNNTRSAGDGRSESKPCLSISRESADLGGWQFLIASNESEETN